MSSIEKTYRKGEVIISEGHFARSFYVIQKGMVEVVKKKGSHEVLLSKLGPNDFFGEMSLLDPELGMHSATVRAMEDTTVLVMHKEDFQKFVGQLTPGMKKIMEVLVYRLRETSELVEYTKESVDEQTGPDHTVEEERDTQENKAE